MGARTSAKVRDVKPAPVISVESLGAKLAEAQEYIVALQADLTDAKEEARRLRDRIGQTRRPENPNPRLYDLHCPLCKQAFEDTVSALKAMAAYDRRIFGNLGGGGHMVKVGEHPRCRDCSILLGPTHNDAAGELCSSCETSRQKFGAPA